MYTAYVGWDNISNMLLEAGAKVGVPAKRNGLTALMLASYYASESSMCFLPQVCSKTEIRSRQIHRQERLWTSFKRLCRKFWTSFYVSEAYLEPSRTSTMELFCENS